MIDAAAGSRRTLTWLTFLLAALFMAGAFLSGPRAWGLNHWAAFPKGAFAIAALVLIAALSPWGRAALVRLLQPLATALEDPRRARLTAALTVAAFAAAFWFGRERTFFLSDGEPLIRGIGQTVKSSFEADLLSFRIQAAMSSLFRDTLHVSSLTASFRIVAFLSGIVWLTACFATAGTLTERGWERILLGGLPATLGFTRLFYGYVETSPLLAAASAIYVWRAVVFLKTGKGEMTVAAALLAALAMHLTAVLLLPSYLFVIVAAPSRAARRVLLLVAGLPVAAGAAWVLLRAGGGGASSARYTGYFSGFVPLAGPLGPKHAYTLLSPDHWNDFLQQQILLGPFALIALIAIGIGAAFSRRGTAAQRGGTADQLSGRGAAPSDDDGFGVVSRFLLALVIPIALLSFFYGREIGGARDWDILAGATLPAALWVGMVAIRAWRTVAGRAAGGAAAAAAQPAKTGPPAKTARKEPAAISAADPVPLPQLTVMMLAVSLFHLAPWVLVDAVPAWSVARFETLTSPGAPLSRFARAYGYEELGRYYLERDDFPNAKTWFARAVETDPSDVKALSPLAYITRRLGETGEAIRYYQAAAHLRPASADYQFELAEALREGGRPADAVIAYRAALHLDPARPAAWLGLGSASFAAGEFASADSAYAAALNRDPGSADLWFNRGLARENLGDAAAARQFYEKALAINSDHRAASFALGTLDLKEGRPAEAIPCFEKVRQQDPAAIDATVNLALAQAYLGRAVDVTATLASVGQLDVRLVHAYMDAAMILAGQGRRTDALALLAACRARDESLAQTSGAVEMMKTLSR